MIDNQTIKARYEQSKTDKQLIVGQYSRIAKFTLPYSNIYTNSYSKNVSKKINIIDPVILQSHKDLNNFVMSTMLKTTNWADVELDEDIFEALLIDIEQLQQIKYDEVKNVLQADSYKVFKFLANSNFNATVSKAMTECINLGTGCIKITEKKSQTDPFTFQFISIAELNFLENEFGVPNETYVVHRDNDKVKKTFNIDDGDNRTFIESVFPMKDGKFLHQVTDEAFEDVLYKAEIDYNPFIIFRFSNVNAQQYGLGLGFELIDEFERMKTYKDFQRKSAELEIFPPLGYIGAIELMHKLNMGIGQINYLGVQSEIAGIQRMNTNSNYLPMNDEILKSEQLIRDTYLSQPIGNYNDRKNLTASEISIRVQMFRERFAGTYEILSNELLKSSFINIFKLMASRSLLEFPIEFITYVNLKYINKVTRDANRETAEEVILFKQTMDQTFPQISQIGFNVTEILPTLAEMLEIPGPFVLTTEELLERFEEMQDAEAKENEILAQQQEEQQLQEQQGG